jgi:choline-sulfatase
MSILWKCANSPFNGKMKNSPQSRFLAWLLGLVLLPGVLAGQTRPNILWIVADDQVPYVMGAYGNKQVRTPRLDRLAAQGMRFDRAFCTSPLCTASRQSFFTGLYPRTIGVTQLKTSLPADAVTLAQVLKSAGYDTAAIGKMHFNSELKHGFDLRLDLEDHKAWLKAKGREPLPAGIEVQPDWKPFVDPAAVWLNSACRPLGFVKADMAGTWFAQRAAEYLSQPRQRPFFLMVGFYQPHSPFDFPVEYRGRHQAGEPSVPRPGPGDDWQIPEVFRSLTDGEKQGIIAAYYTSVEFLDETVGRVLDALDQSGKSRETLVIFLGDNGYLLGQHGRFEKHCGYEEAVRCPLLVRYPGRVKPGGQTAALVEFIDLFPTILDYAGLPTPANVQGRSLLALLAGRTQRHRDQVFIEYSENEEACVRTERWKLIYCTGKRLRTDGFATGHPLPGRTVQLFDLEQDPGEMTNVAARPENAELVVRLTAQLAEHLKSTARQPELVPQTGDVQAVLDYCLQPSDHPSP